MNSNPSALARHTIFGHPTGLFTLFFAEMWERFSYYGMRALLLFYMIKGFLGYGDDDAYAVYGAYTALVYMMPFFGGILADRLLGARRAVILGGLLMAAGHLMMTVENSLGFFTALALLICGNGFFKPNISTIVGSLYPKGSLKRDGGFTIFYMGINLGAAMSPLLCGYIGETYGWHYGFGLATIGMLTGVAVFVAPSVISQTAMFLLAIAATLNIFVVPHLFPDRPALMMWLNFDLLALLVVAGCYSFLELGWGRLVESWLSKVIAWVVLASGAVVAAGCMFYFHPENPFSAAVNILVGVSLLIAAAVACVAIYFGGLPKEAGAAPDPQRLRRRVLGLVPLEWTVYLATAVVIAVFVLLVSGFALLTDDGRPVSLVPKSFVEDLEADELMYDYFARLEKPLASKDQNSIKRLAKTYQELQEKNEVRGRQLAALSQVVQLAQQGRWEEAQAKAAQSRPEPKEDGKKQDPAEWMNARLDEVERVLAAKDKAAIDQLGETLQRLRKENERRAQQLAALTGVAQLAQEGHWEDAQTDAEQARVLFPRGRMKNILAVVLKETSRPAGLVLILAGLGAFVYLGIETIRLDHVPRQRMYVVLILTFFSMLFWAFFEQAGSSVNNFTDRNVDRVFEQQSVSADQVGKTIQIQPTQEQLGYHNGERLFTIDQLARLRDQNKDDPDFSISWNVVEDNVGMGLAGRRKEIPASTFQSINPIYILIFGLVFTALWAVLSRLGWEPSTPVKFALGLAQLGLGFGAFWYGAQTANARGMVGLEWLFVGYLFQTTGELCLSPVGLAMITRLSPARLVSTVMGAWFLATAFSQFLAAIIAQFTGVSEGNGSEAAIPIPKETVHIYGDVFGTIAISALVSGLICLALAPLLTRWMHVEEIAGTEQTTDEEDY